MIVSSNPYKNDFFNKLNFKFEKGKKLLDAGCGDGLDAKIFHDAFGLNVYGFDIYTDKNIKKINMTFKEGSIYDIPFASNLFDYVFLHDVLHHIDEDKHRKDRHVIALRELIRVCKTNGYIILTEGNRYNPLFYPHMVKMRGHEHWKQSYFKEIINEVYKGNQIKFKFFEAHSYPKWFLFGKIYERFMELFSPKSFLAYNCAIIKKI